MIAFGTAGCTALFWQLFSKRQDLISHFSIATAYPALVLTAAALVLGPWNVLRGRHNPVSFDHLRGRPWLYFVDEHKHIRHDIFGFSNDTGLIAALLFLLLLAISNDLSLRRLGTRRWKSLQRWTYVAAALTGLHAVAYQQVEKRQAAYQVMVWGITAGLTALQLAGWSRTTRGCQRQSL